MSQSPELKNSVGVGLRKEHYSHLETSPETGNDWFEIISENYLNSEGRPVRVLEQIRQDYPVAMHGVSLSLASCEPIDADYLKKLKSLVRRIEPFIVSDHLCFTGMAASNTHNLLPFPFNRESLEHLCCRIDQVQNLLGRKMIFENLSAYFDYRESTMTEWDFISELCRKSGCQLLLDINNIFVNSQNNGFDQRRYIDAIPEGAVAQMHLAGHSDMGDFLFDTHSGPVSDPVWALYAYALKSGIRAPTLIEWDENVPDFSVLEAEVTRTRTIMHEVRT